MKVLSTKQLETNAIASAHDLQLDLTCLNFIEIKGVDYHNEALNFNDYDTVVFTSSNAVDFFIVSQIQIDILKTKKIASLEGSSKATLAKYGLAPIATAADSKQLADILQHSSDVKSVLHPCGSLALDTLQHTLETADIQYKGLVVYETILQPQQLTETYDFILFYSPSGVNSFFSQNKLSPSTVCCCIGTTTAAALKEKEPQAMILIPEKPNPVAMLEIVHHYIFNNKEQ
ncbi:MAG: uroporphyrinogen-III synthase [Bacteroidota bacterium]